MFHTHDDFMAGATSVRWPARSAQLARLAGVSADTLRYYERKGLLPPAARSAGGYRIYTADALERVRMIRSALAAGFSIADLARVFRMSDRGGIPCRQVRDLAASRLAEITRQIRELRAVRDQLRRVLADWDRLLAGAGPGRRAFLLKKLAAAHPGNAKKTSPLLPGVLRRQRR